MTGAWKTNIFDFGTWESGRLGCKDNLIDLSRGLRGSVMLSASLKSGATTTSTTRFEILERLSNLGWNDPSDRHISDILVNVI